MFGEADPGYGFVNGETPELGIAFKPEFRQQGVGRRLLGAIMDQARLDGFASLSLSVDPANEAAVRLYSSLGFERCGGYTSSWTMKVEL
ncbi:GNAT family N-acetyltransferase [Paenibacillus koleovorans]|uniref:GNAT family N-acetyltransferase n=1 Tax=Paenibacillus koleovorans TaxID=121608 RepID=UPI000FDC269A|nr:GNAT family N-acetyltransferase [Paenibacillus koleovorans]